MLGPFSRLAEEAHQPLLGYNTRTLLLPVWGTEPRRSFLTGLRRNLLEGVLNWPLHRDIL
jgi:hypothetical protein